jgi:hypothetical protein
MATLSELVKFRNDLKIRISDLSLEMSINEKISILSSVITNNPSVCYDVTDLVNSYRYLIVESYNIIDKLNQLISTIESDIDDIAKQLIKDENNRLQFTEKRFNTSGNIYQIDDFETFNLINYRIKRYTSWQYPGLQLYPTSDAWIDLMVANDPLYLVHHDYDFLKSQITKYPSTYQNRLRLYKIFNQDLSDLPQNQFGFVLSWGMMTHLIADKVEMYLEGVFNLLRPGGVFMFDYNNCDLENLAKLAEYNYKSYNSSRLITNLCEKIGYEIICFNDIELNNLPVSHISWVELRKPGKLTTIKAHQALGQVIEN